MKTYACARKFSFLLLLMICGSMSAPRAFAQASLVANWRLDDGSGPSAADSSGGSHTGTLVNGPTWTAAGRVNGALTFGGTATGITVPGGGNLANLYATGMSVSAWIKPTSAGAGAKGRIADKTNWMLRMGSATTLEFIADQWSSGFAQRTSTTQVALNTWQHVVATWDGQQNAGATAGAGIHLYINGVLADGASVNGVGTAGSDAAVPLMIGNSYGLSRGFAGSLDEVRIYNRVLTGAEIRALADATPPTAPTSATATVSGSQITVSWSGATDNVAVTTYRIERCQGVGCTSFVQAGVIGASPWVNSGLAPATTYRYRVFAIDANANVSSGASPVAQAATGGTGGGGGTDTVAPSTPSGLAVSAASSAEIDLIWSASTDNVGVTGYEYERCQGTACSTLPVPPGPASASVAYLFDAGRAALTAYRYRVRAKDAAGNASAWSSPALNYTTPASSPDCD